MAKTSVNRPAIDGRTVVAVVFATGRRLNTDFVSTTYANVTVLGADHAAVVAALGDGPALVTDAVDGMTVVFAAADEEAARFGEGLTAAALSAACSCTALEVSVYDDQILQYRLYRRGAETDVGVVATPMAVQLAEQAAGSLPEADAARLDSRLARGNEQHARRALSAAEPRERATDSRPWVEAARALQRCAQGCGDRDLAAFA